MKQKKEFCKRNPDVYILKLVDPRTNKRRWLITKSQNPEIPKSRNSMLNLTPAYSTRPYMDL